MEAIVILSTVIFVGYALCNILTKQIVSSFRLPYAFLLGSCFSIPLLYLMRVFLFHDLHVAVAGWILACAVPSFLILERRNRVDKTQLNSWFKLLLFAVTCLLFYFVFNKTFSYANNSFLIASNMYLDLGAHIPFIRAFANNTNYPFEVPFYVNGQIQYHFMFDFYTGVLEALGMRIDVAYNLLSALTISSLFFLFLDFGKNVFKKKRVGVVSFFLFFLPFNYSFFNAVIKSHGNLLTLWRSNTYGTDSFLGGNTVGNFLYINTYINQRHLLFALSIALITVMMFWNSFYYKKEVSIWRGIIIGILVGFLSLWNMPIFVILEIVILLFLLFFKMRVQSLIVLVFSILISSPQILQNINGTHSGLLFNPGYLIYKDFSFSNLFVFWVLNLGLSILAILLGFFFSPRNLKKLFVVLLPIFILPNLFQFSSDMFDNHKFFNFWFMFMCFFQGYVVLLLYRKRGKYAIAAATMFVLLVVTSLTSTLVVKNDIYARIPDYNVMSFSKFIHNTIPVDSVVVTNGEIYDPLSLSGRKTYLGRSQYIYLYGAHPESRISIVNSLFTKDASTVSGIVRQNMIKYIVIYKGEVKNPIKTSRGVFDKLYKVIYEDGFAIIYKT